MTRERIYGSDTPFCEWLRHCKDLPSYSNDFGVVAADNDLTIHKYITSIDGEGTRACQAIMQVEIKTRKGKPSESQIDTLAKMNLFKGNRFIDGSNVRFFGVFVLVMSELTPDDSESMWWYRFPKNKTIKSASQLQGKKITRTTLVDIFRFDLHPWNLSPSPFRRHHKTNEIIYIETTPLGFTCERTIKKRS